MLISPKTRYQVVYNNLSDVREHLRNRGYQISGFGRVSEGDVYLTRGVRGVDDIDTWEQTFKSVGAYIKLVKIA